MKRAIAIALHPVTYYRFRKVQEQIVLLYLACEILGIEQPTVWDVDRIRETISRTLDAMHDVPSMLDGSPCASEHLFWTRLASRFARLTVTRECVKEMVEMYGITEKSIRVESPRPLDVVAAHVAMIKMFGEFV